MKYRLVLCLLFVALSAGAKKYHQFTNAKGQKLWARIVRYDDAKKQVLLDCKGKGSKRVPITVFSEEDQQYILDWDLSRKFLDDHVLKFFFDEKKEEHPEKTIDHGFDETFFWDAWIEFVIQNNSAVSFENVTVEYTLFYAKEIPKGAYEQRGQKEKKRETVYAKQTLDLRKYSRAPFSTEKLELSRYSGGPWPPMRGEIEGLILKMTLPLKSGGTVVRMVRYPKGLKREWTTENKTVERNW